jgi:hypothetical protein
MTTLMRLMVVKQRSGWGYETLVREVSDSLHLRRFCRIALTERVPDESTVRKLVRRLGPEVIDEICRVVIAAATTGERRFVARAARIDSTVLEADVRYPTDIGLAADASKTLARAGAVIAGSGAPRVRDRSRAIGRRERRLNRTLAARTGQGRPTALRLTGEAGALVERSVREARRLAEHLRRGARGRGAQRKLAAARRLEDLAERAGIVARQIRQRLAGERITNRLVSMTDPDARPIRKGKLRAPTEFGSVVQLAEVCENTRRGARGLIVPAATEIGSPNEPDLLPATAAELQRLTCVRASSRSTAGSSRSASPRSSPDPSACSSPAASPPAPDAPTDGSRASGSASRAASATSNAATASNDPDSKASAERGPGPPGRSSPTTSTRSPSEPAENIPQVRDHPPGRHPNIETAAPLHPARPFSFQPVYPGQVARRQARQLAA